MTGDQAIRRKASIGALKAESDNVSYRLAELNQEMMRLPINERRGRWDEYYRRLGQLMKRQDEIWKAMTAVLNPHPDHQGGSGQ